MRVALQLLVGVILAVGLLAWAAPHAQAQYPPPIGSVSTSVDSPTAAAGSNVNVTCTVRDTSGAPVAGQTCTFSISSQPGSDASFGGSSSTVKTTDTNGIATAVLSIGSTPGNIVVSTDAGGIFSQVTVDVQGAGGAPTTPQQLPTSGSGPAPAGSAGPWWPLAGILTLGITLVLLAGAFIAVRSQRIRA